MERIKTNTRTQIVVSAISEILGQPKKYLGAPSYGFTVGSITINKEGTATGVLSYKLLEALAERGFVPETDAEAEATEPETETPEEPSECKAEIQEAQSESDTEDLRENNVATECEAQFETEEFAETNNTYISVPLDGFSPEKLDILIKLIDSKAVLIKKALGVDTLPVKIIDDKIIFDWFKSSDSENMAAYTQFIAALCETAKEKKRVTAKPQEYFENERFALRVWLIGLGLIGREYSQIRALLTKPLSGNSAFRFGKPEVGVEDISPEITASEAAIAAEEAPADMKPWKIPQLRPRTRTWPTPTPTQPLAKARWMAMSDHSTWKPITSN